MEFSIQWEYRGDTMDYITKTSWGFYVQFQINVQILLMWTSEVSFSIGCLLGSLHETTNR